MEIMYECKYGNKCERNPKDGCIVRCSQYIKVVGVDPNTGESVDLWDCAENWRVKFQMETNKLLRQLIAGQDQLRSEQKNGQDVFNTLIYKAVEDKLLLS